MLSRLKDFALLVLSTPIINLNKWKLPLSSKRSLIKCSIQFIEKSGSVSTMLTNVRTLYSKLIASPPSLCSEMELKSTDWKDPEPMSRASEPTYRILVIRLNHGIPTQILLSTSIIWSLTWLDSILSRVSQEFALSMPSPLEIDSVMLLPLRTRTSLRPISVDSISVSSM